MKIEEGVAPVVAAFKPLPVLIRLAVEVDAVVLVPLVVPPVVLLVAVVLVVPPPPVLLTVDPALEDGTMVGHEDGNEQSMLT